MKKILFVWGLEYKMVEPFAKPNSRQVEKLREQIGDPMLFCLMNGVIQNLNKLCSGKLSPRNNASWKSDTSLIINNWGLSYAMDWIYHCVEESGKTTEQRLKECDISDLTEKKPEETYFIDPLSKQLPILAVAKKYGLKVRNDKCICPFHADSDPSLTFYPKTNSFYCFGCHQGGDLLKFIQMLEELKK